MKAELYDGLMEGHSLGHRVPSVDKGPGAFTFIRFPGSAEADLSAAAPVANYRLARHGDGGLVARAPAPFQKSYGQNT